MHLQIETARARSQCGPGLPDSNHYVCHCVSNIVPKMGRPTKKLALLAIDMQVQFSGVAKPPLVQKLNDLAAFLRSRGVPIIYTHHGHPDPAAEEDTDVLVGFLGAANSIKCALT